MAPLPSFACEVMFLGRMRDRMTTTRRVITSSFSQGQVGSSGEERECGTPGGEQRSRMLACGRAGAGGDRGRH